jgi:hypothetical protein
VEDEEESRMVLSLDDNTIKLWDIEAGGSSAKETGTITLGTCAVVRSCGVSHVCACAVVRCVR